MTRGIVCPELFPLRRAKWTNDIISREDPHNLFFTATISDFSISPNTDENSPNWFKIYQVRRKNLKCLIKGKKNPKFEKKSCQDLVAMETSRH